MRERWYLRTEGDIPDGYELAGVSVCNGDRRVALVVREVGLRDDASSGDESGVGE